MDNPEILEIIAIQGTGRRQSKNQYKPKKNQKNHKNTTKTTHTHKAQSTKMMSNTDPHQNTRSDPKAKYS